MSELITKYCKICSCPTDTLQDGKCQYCAEYDNTRIPDYAKSIAWFVVAVSALMLLLLVIFPS